MTEFDFSINGKRLSYAESMTIHVALQNFTMDMKEKKFMQEAYLQNIKNIYEKAKSNSEEPRFILM